MIDTDKQILAEKISKIMRYDQLFYKPGIDELLELVIAELKKKDEQCAVQIAAVKSNQAQLILSERLAEKEKTVEEVISSLVKVLQDKTPPGLITAIVEDLRDYLQPQTSSSSTIAQDYSPSKKCTCTIVGKFDELPNPYLKINDDCPEHCQPKAGREGKK